MRRILIVDDSAVIHALFKHILGRLEECTLSFAKTGEEGLTLIERDGEPALILLDVNMPVMDGLEMLEELVARGVHQRVPVVMVSTEGHEDDVTRALEAGATAYLRKPFDFAEVKRLVEELLPADREATS